MWITLEDGTQWSAMEWSESHSTSEEPSRIASVRTSFRPIPRKEQRIAAIRIRLHNPGLLPNWHPGAGGETFIFIDEISISTR